MAGKCLHHFGGALYLAVDNFVYATKTHNIEQMDIRYNIVAGFADPVTMIKHVANGLFVGTTKGVYFLEGGGIVVDEQGKLQAGFSQQQVTPYGSIYGTDIEIHAGIIPDLQATGMAVLWSSRMGVFAGLPGGTAINLSADKMITMGDIIVEAEKLFNKKVQVVESKPDVINVRNLANRKAKELLGWKPEIDLAAGLKTLEPYL